LGIRGAPEWLAFFKTLERRGFCEELKALLALAELREHVPFLHGHKHQGREEEAEGKQIGYCNAQLSLLPAVDSNPSHRSSRSGDNNYCRRSRKVRIANEEHQCCSTGMIDAIPLPSTQALAGQIYSIAKNMLSLNWSVLSGGTVIKKDLWDKISPDLQKKLMDSAAVAGTKMRTASRKEDEDAVKAMQAKGLKVNVASPQVEQEWYKLTSIIYPKIRGKMVPDDIFDEVQRLVAEYRAGNLP
jgi:hypothetical protein